jgi:hypothetical protein
MAKIEPKQKYHIQFAQDQQGNQLRHRFILSLDRPIKTKAMLAKVSQLLDHDLPGVDRGTPLGRYSLEIVIAQTFDADEVLDELKARLDELLSDIILPKSEIIKP